MIERREAWNLHEKIMWSSWREHEIYLKRSWNLYKDSINLHYDKFRSTIIDHDIHLRAWDQDEDSMSST